MRILIEDDFAIRPVRSVLDPACPASESGEWATHFGLSQDYSRWLTVARADLPQVFPAEVVVVRDEKQLAAEIHNADGLIVEHLRVSAEVLKAAPRLRFVQKFGTITTNIENGAGGPVLLTYDRKANVAVAEHALALVMALAKRLHDTGGQVAPGQLAAIGATWRRVPRLITLHGLTLGLVGYGEIARVLGRFASALGMRVVYYARREADGGGDAVLTSLHELMRESDIVSVHLPLNASTRGLIGASELTLMKPGALFINTARADIVERESLLDCLRERRIAGAGLDVHYEEPITDSDPFLSLDNVLLTPHVASASRENVLGDVLGVLANIEAHLKVPGTDLAARYGGPMIKKQLFVEQATTTGGRRGVARTPDGRIELKLDSPPQLGGAGQGSNPEQLFACAYSACFGGTIEFLARQEGLQVAESQVTAGVTFGLSDRGGYELAIKLNVYLPGVSREITERLIAAAHDLCPVSRAIHGNVEVATHIVDGLTA